MAKWIPVKKNPLSKYEQWDEASHPRKGKGKGGGEFTSAGNTAGTGEAPKPAAESKPAPKAGGKQAPQGQPVRAQERVHASPQDKASSKAVASLKQVLDGALKAGHIDKEEHGIQMALARRYWDKPEAAVSQLKRLGTDILPPGYKRQLSQLADTYRREYNGEPPAAKPAGRAGEAAPGEPVRIDPQAGLHGMLTAISGFHPVRQGFKYNSAEEFVMKHGQSFKPQPRPKNLPKDPDKNCFGNAFNLCLEHPELTYVEGYATPANIGIPILHAWAVDKGGNVIDTTWKTPGSEYIGVPMDFGQVKKFVLGTKKYGVLGGDFAAAGKYLKDGFPEGFITKVPGGRKPGLHYEPVTPEKAQAKIKELTRKHNELATQHNKLRAEGKMDEAQKLRAEIGEIGTALHSYKQFLKTGGNKLEDQSKLPNPKEKMPAPGHDPKIQNSLAQARKLMQEVRSNEGFTYQPVTGRSPKEGYALSVYPEREVIVPPDQLTAKLIRGYINANRDLLSSPESHVGAWFDKKNDKIFLDISMVTNDTKDAVARCQKYNQIAYYDLKLGKEVRVQERAGLTKGTNMNLLHFLIPGDATDAELDEVVSKLAPHLAPQTPEAPKMVKVVRASRLIKVWEEDKHPRRGKGEGGGQFAPKGQGGGGGGADVPAADVPAAKVPVGGEVRQEANASDAKLFPTSPERLPGDFSTIQTGLLGAEKGNERLAHQGAMHIAEIVADHPGLFSKEEIAQAYEQANRLNMGDDPRGAYVAYARAWAQGAKKSGADWDSFKKEMEDYHGKVLQRFQGIKDDLLEHAMGRGKRRLKLLIDKMRDNSLISDTEYAGYLGQIDGMTNDTEMLGMLSELKGNPKFAGDVKSDIAGIRADFELEAQGKKPVNRFERAVRVIGGAGAGAKLGELPAEGKNPFEKWDAAFMADAIAPGDDIAKWKVMLDSWSDRDMQRLTDYGLIRLWQHAYYYGMAGRGNIDQMDVAREFYDKTLKELQGRIISFYGESLGIDDIDKILNDTKDLTPDQKRGILLAIRMRMGYSTTKTEWNTYKKMLDDFKAQYGGEEGLPAELPKPVVSQTAIHDRDQKFGNQMERAMIEANTMWVKYAIGVELENARGFERGDFITETPGQRMKRAEGIRDRFLQVLDDHEADKERRNKAKQKVVDAFNEWAMAEEGGGGAKKAPVIAEHRIELLPEILGEAKLGDKVNGYYRLVANGDITKEGLYPANRFGGRIVRLMDAMYGAGVPEPEFKNAFEALDMLSAANHHQVPGTTEAERATKLYGEMRDVIGRLPEGDLKENAFAALENANQNLINPDADTGSKLTTIDLKAAPAPAGGALQTNSMLPTEGRWAGGASVYWNHGHWGITMNRYGVRLQQIGDAMYRLGVPEADLEALSDEIKVINEGNEFIDPAKAYNAALGAVDKVKDVRARVTLRRALRNAINYKLHHENDPFATEGGAKEGTIDAFYGIPMGNPAAIQRPVENEIAIGKNRLGDFPHAKHVRFLDIGQGAGEQVQMWYPYNRYHIRAGRMLNALYRAGVPQEELKEAFDALEDAGHNVQVSLKHPGAGEKRKAQAVYNAYMRVIDRLPRDMQGNPRAELHHMIAEFENPSAQRESGKFTQLDFRRGAPPLVHEPVAGKPAPAPAPVAKPKPLSASSGGGRVLPAIPVVRNPGAEPAPASAPAPIADVPGATTVMKPHLHEAGLKRLEHVGAGIAQELMANGHISQAQHDHVQARVKEAMDIMGQQSSMDAQAEVKDIMDELYADVKGNYTNHLAEPYKNAYGMLEKARVKLWRMQKAGEREAMKAAAGAAPVPAALPAVPPDSGSGASQFKDFKNRNLGAEYRPPRTAPPEHKEFLQMAAVNKITHLKPLGGMHANPAYRGVVDGDGKCVWKPWDGDRHGGYGVAQTEQFTYDVNVAVGFHTAPPVCCREDPEKPGSIGAVLQWVDGEMGGDVVSDGSTIKAQKRGTTVLEAPVTEQTRADFSEMTVSDIVLLNRDRNSGNYIVSSDGRIHQIDNGLNMLEYGMNMRGYGDLDSIRSAALSHSTSVCKHVLGDSDVYSHIRRSDAEKMKAFVDSPEYERIVRKNFIRADAVKMFAGSENGAENFVKRVITGARMSAEMLVRRKDLAKG